jgi:hypothetical protein
MAEGDVYLDDSATRRRGPQAKRRLIRGVRRQCWRRLGAIVDRTDIPWRSDQCRSLGLKKA